MDLKNFTSAIAQIAEEKGIPYEKVIEIIEMAIAAAYKKDYGKKGQIVKAKLDPETGQARFWQVRGVVDETMVYSEEELELLKAKTPQAEGEEGREEEKEEDEEELGEGEKKIKFNPEKHIMLEDAKKISPKIKVGEDLEQELEMKDGYGRIAAQTAKQVIMQRLREVEREVVFSEYKSKEGEIISGIVQRIEGRNIFFDIGKTLGLLPKEEQVPGEFYRPGQRLKVYILKVEETSKGPIIFLSRAYPKIISKLFELEVPEVSSGSVLIKSIAREPGSRSKIAVESKVEGVDPIGSMVGQKGTRVSAVIAELGGEKIDIIEYSDDPEKYLANSLLPAKVTEVKVLPRNRALCIVPEDQLSLAIGKDGQNVRLAAKLTGWKIDVRPEGQDIGEVEEDVDGEDVVEQEKDEEKNNKGDDEKKDPKGKKVKKTKTAIKKKKIKESSE